MNRQTGVLLALALVLAQAQASPQEDAAAYYEDALMRFDANDFAGAEIQLKNALQRQPGHLAARLLLGRVYLGLGRYELAEVEVQAAGRAGADRAKTAVSLARLYLLQGKHQVLLDQIASEGLPAAAQAQILVQRGLALTERGQPFEAEQAFAEAEQRDPQAAASRAGMAMLRLRQGQFAEAEAAADEAIALGPRDADAWNAWAAVRHRSGRLEEALQGYDYVLALAPQYLAARFAKLGLLLDLDRAEAMTADLEYLQRHAVRDPRALLLRALWSGRRGDEAAARAQMAEAAGVLKSIPAERLVQDPQLLLASGLAHYSVNEFERARDDFDRFIRRNPDHAGARKLLGASYLQLGEARQALGVLEPLRPRADKDPQLLGLLGMAYMRTGGYTLATELFERAAALSGGASDIAVELAASRIRSGDPGKALAELGEAFDRDPAQVRAGVLLAGLQLRLGRSAEAARTTARLLEREADNPTVLELRATALLAAGDAAGARAALERAIVTAPDFLPAHIGLSRLDLAQGRPEAADARLRERLQAQPENAALMIELARVADVGGRRDEARRWLEKARAADAGSLAARLHLVEFYLRQADAAQALAVAEEAVGRAPENLDALAALARTQLAAGNLPQAQVTLRRMDKLAGFDPELLLGIARLQMQARLPADAAFAAEKAARAAPARSDIAAVLVTAYLGAGRLADAEQRVRELLEAQPDSALAHGLLGEVLMRTRHFADAAEAYRHGLELEPRAELALGLYRARLAAGQSAAARAGLETWLKAHPDDRVIQQALAEACLRDGDWQGAQTLYERLLAARPEDPALLNNLANIYLATGDARARDTAQRALAKAPEDPLALDTLGWILVRQGDAAQGLQYLRDAQSRLSANPEVGYHLGVALQRLGRAAEARRQLEQALAAGQDFPGSEDARRLLESLRR